MRAVPCLCGFYPGICLTTEEKAREKKNLIMVIKSRNVKCEKHVAAMDEIGNTNKSSVKMSKNKGTSGGLNYTWQKKKATANINP